eukprot:jgi/Chlat1/5233/Chrsp33S05076
MSHAAAAAAAAEPLCVLRGHAAEVQAVTFLPEGGAGGGRRLASGDSQGEVKIWDLPTRRPLGSWDSVRGYGVGCSAVIIRASRVTAHGRDGLIKCWELTREGLPGSEPVCIIDTGAYGFCKLAVLPPFHEGVLVAAATGEAGELCVWDISTMTRVCTWTQSTAGMLTSVALFRWNGQVHAVAGYEDGSMCLWRMQDAEPVSTVKLHSEPVLGVAVSERGTHIMSGSADCEVIHLVVDALARSIKVLHRHQIPKPGTDALAVRSDDACFAAGGWDRRVRVYNMCGQRACVLKYHSAAVTGLSFTGDGQLLASGSRDATIALWSVLPPRALPQVPLMELMSPKSQ